MLTAINGSYVSVKWNLFDVEYIYQTFTFTFFYANEVETVVYSAQCFKNNWWELIIRLSRLDRWSRDVPL